MKNLKVVTGAFIIAILLAIRILIENTKYVDISNILFPVIISFIIPWLLFEYQFRRQKESEQITEKLKVHNKLFEILKRARNRYLSENEQFDFYDFTGSEIKEIRKIFEDNRHMLSPEICTLWHEIINEENYNRDSLLSSDFRTSDKEILIPLMMDDSLLNLVKTDLNKLQKKISH